MSVGKLQRKNDYASVVLVLMIKVKTVEGLGDVEPMVVNLVITVYCTENPQNLRSQDVLKKIATNFYPLVSFIPLSSKQRFFCRSCGREDTNRTS